MGWLISRKQLGELILGVCSFLIWSCSGEMLGFAEKCKPSLISTKEIKQLQIPSPLNNDEIISRGKPFVISRKNSKRSSNGYIYKVKGVISLTSGPTLLRPLAEESGDDEDKIMSSNYATSSQEATTRTFYNYSSPLPNSELSTNVTVLDEKSQEELNVTSESVSVRNSPSTTDLTPTTNIMSTAGFITSVINSDTFTSSQAQGKDQTESTALTTPMTTTPSSSTFYQNKSTFQSTELMTEKEVEYERSTSALMFNGNSTDSIPSTSQWTSNTEAVPAGETVNGSSTGLTDYSSSIGLNAAASPTSPTTTKQFESSPTSSSELLTTQDPLLITSELTMGTTQVQILFSSTDTPSDNPNENSTSTFTTSMPQSPASTFKFITTMPTSLDTFPTSPEPKPICDSRQWLLCDSNSSQCICQEGLKYEASSKKCLSLKGKECQSGERFCIKNAVCSSTTIGQLGVCDCKDGFLPGKDGDCLPGLGSPCDNSCFPGMTCSKSNSSCVCQDGWEEGKPGSYRCYLSYNSKCNLKSDEKCNTFNFLNCSATSNECKCEDEVNQLFDMERKACVAFTGRKCKLKDYYDDEGRRLFCIKNAECKNSSCECLMGYENDWRGNCQPKNTAFANQYSWQLIIAFYLALKFCNVN